MLAVSTFIRPKRGTREFTAVKKAQEQSPRVDYLGTVRGCRYYLVQGTFGAERIVKVWQDRDSECWVQCLSCPSGSPPIDRTTRLPQWEPSPCFHAAATLLAFEEHENK